MHAKAGPALAAACLWAALAAACRTPVAPVARAADAGTAVDPQGFTRVRSEAGTLDVLWRAQPSPLPKNEDFLLEVRLESPGTPPLPVSGARLFVSAWMPAHGHGMLRSAKTSERGGGAYEVRGMLLHMTGAWELVFDALVAGRAERARYALELP